MVSSVLMIVYKLLDVAQKSIDSKHQSDQGVTTYFIQREHEYSKHCLIALGNLGISEVFV